MIELPVAWILGIIGTLGTVIAGLASLLWGVVKSRIAAQDAIIAGLRSDIDRMSKGCGYETCHWRQR
jgi:hypothetical protein